MDGHKVEGTFRAHQVPLSDPRGNPAHLELLEQWLESYRPDELFDERGALRPELAALAPNGPRRMGANPRANGGRLLRELQLARLSRLRRGCPVAGRTSTPKTRASSAASCATVVA